MTGTAPAVLLLHGIGDSSEAWRPLHAGAGRALHGDRPGPARPRRVGQAPGRLLGRGLRQRHAATCSTSLGIERATVVGHSLGGGVAAQFVYQYPERVRAAGAGRPAAGVGPEVAPILRMAAAPFAELALPLHALAGRVGSAGRVVIEALRRTGTDARPRRRPRSAGVRRAARRPGPRCLHPHAALGRRLARPGRRRCSTGATWPRACPCCSVWGEPDAVIPIRHAHLAHAAMAGSRLEVYAGRRPLPPPRRPRPLRAPTCATSWPPPSRPTTTTSPQGAARPGRLASAARAATRSLVGRVR